MPNFDLETQYDGPVFGLDEVGRGPLAGPVVAACVYIPKDTYTLPFIPDIRDSKKLSHTKLENLYTLITNHFTWSIFEISPQDIDRINILQASLTAMRCALKGMDIEPVHALIDGNKIPRQLPCPASAIIKGDNKSYSIAAASIVAKVTRDRIMYKLHETHPHYGWNTNVGYPSKAHREAIDVHGITEHHRKSYAPIKNYLAYGSTRNPIETAV